MSSTTPTTMKSSPNAAHQGFEGTADLSIDASLANESRQLLTLPNEILLKVLSLLYNEDLVEFALTCSTVHRLANTALCEHRELMREWTTVSNLNMARGYLASRVAMQLIDPRLGSYTHILIIRLREPPCPIDDPNDDPGQFIAQALAADVRPPWTEIFGLERWQIWEREVKESNVDSILGTFFCILEYVKRLTIYLEGIERPFLLGSLEPFTEEGYGALSSLDSLHIDGFASNHSFLSYQFLEVGARILSVTELKASNIILNDLEDGPTIPPFESYVESFKLENCCLGTRYMVAMLSSMQALKHFSHKECQPVSHSYQAALVDSLKCVARKTLMSFNLIDQAPMDSDDGLPLDSLADFETLQQVTLEFKNLISIQPGQTSISWRTQLPKSIQRLKLVRKSCRVGSRSVQAVLEALLRNKGDCWPDLEEFMLVGPTAETADVSEVDQVARRLVDRGVRVTWIYSDSEGYCWRDEDEQTDYGDEGEAQPGVDTTSQLSHFTEDDHGELVCSGSPPNLRQLQDAIEQQQLYPSRALLTGLDFQIMPSQSAKTATGIPDPGHVVTDENAASRTQATSALKPYPILDKLPNELWQNIIGFLYHDHLVNFALTCRFIHQQAQIALREHRYLLQKWSNVSCEPISYGHLASMVAQHLVDPRLASYPKNVQVDEEPASVIEFDGTSTDPGPYVKEATTELVKSCWTARFGIGSWERWKNSVEQGDLDFIFTIWWPMLSHIKTLYLYLEDHEWPLTMDMVRPIHGKHHEQLSHLQTVHVIGPNRQGFAFLELFSRVPSVTLLSASHIGIDDSAICSSIPESYDSNVKHFSLDECTFSTRHIIGLLKAMKHLQYFGYIEEDLPEEWPPEMNRTALVDTLRKGSSKSLRLLDLQFRVGEGLDFDIPIGSLEGFEVLENVTVNPTDFLKGWKRLSKKSPIQLRTGLPRSLKELALGNRNGTVNSKEVATIASILRRAKEESLPNLQKLRIIGLPKRAESSFSQNGNIQGLKALNVYTEVEWSYEESEMDNEEDGTDNEDDETDSYDRDIDSDSDIDRLDAEEQLDDEKE